jgi:hypothetical protein
MKTSDLEIIIKNLAPELYGYAYVLIPDDLQAGQLIIDAAQNFLLRKKSYIDKILLSEVNKKVTDDIQLRLFQVIYEIAKKRFHQIKMSFNLPADKSNFFLSLEFEEKSMLYLRVRATLAIEEIEMIMNKDRASIVAFLSDSRMKMIQKVSTDFHATESGGV